LPPLPSETNANAEREKSAEEAAEADGTNAELEDGRQVQGPLSPQAIRVQRAREILRSAQLLRPLRLLPVGKEAKWTKDDADFVKHALDHDVPVAFVPNPKRRGTTSFLLLEVAQICCWKQTNPRLSLGVQAKDEQEWGGSSVPGSIGGARLSSA
jgi:hypothetical protein